MILLLDIGNSRIKWGLLVEGEFQSGGVTPRDDGDVATLLDDVQLRANALQRVVVSNVAGDKYAAPLREQVKERWGCAVDFVTTQATGFGVVNGYDEPSSLGVDRWLALIAARQSFDGALCVVDCGTALTVDCIGRNGQHLGGMIVPGMALMREALVKNTDGLNVASESEMTDAHLFAARNTAEAIIGGACYSSLALLDRVAVDASEMMGEQATLVITGGGAAALLSNLKHEWHHEPELVLKGIVMVAEEGGR